MKFSFYLITLFSFFCSFSQQKKEDYANDNYFRYDNHVYKSSIRTVLCHESSFEMNPPEIDLHSDQKIQLSFDDLEGGSKTYQYTFFHCDANWNPDDLMVSEYLAGFFDDQITNRSNSFNTVVPYSHYTCSFPNSAIRFTKSGNYVILVYENGNREDFVITRRIRVFENLVSLSARIHQPLGSDALYNTHEVDFSIFFTQYQITNPASDLKIVITQNNRFDNAIVGLKPLFIKDHELSYDYDDGSNCFPAVNEFRSLDIKSSKYPGPTTQRLFRDSTSSIFQIILRNDESRTFKRYLNIPDINGRFLIKSNEAGNSATEADYMDVYFFLPFDYPPDNGNVYIVGGFNQWQMEKENKMTYDSGTKRYLARMRLKQGYYNYYFGFLRDGDSKIEPEYFEGNLGPTENDYSIYVYHRTQGTFYDRLICAKHFNSVKN
jgi:Domain of unknown function (DUF5103)